MFVSSFHPSGSPSPSRGGMPFQLHQQGGLFQQPNEEGLDLFTDGNTAAQQDPHYPNATPINVYQQECTHHQGSYHAAGSPSPRQHTMPSVPLVDPVKQLNLCNKGIVSLTVVRGLNAVAGSIVRLNLHMNKLTEIGDSLRPLVLLEELILSGNEIRELEGFETLHRLRVLDLSCNRLQTIPPCTSLRELKILHTLALSFNSIDNIEGFGELSTEGGYRLKVLELEGNHLKTIESLQPLRNLSLDSLQLSHTAISGGVDEGLEQAAANGGPVANTFSASFGRNPICRLPHYRQIVSEVLPRLRVLDGMQCGIDVRSPQQGGTNYNPAGLGLHSDYTSTPSVVYFAREDSRPRPPPPSAGTSLYDLEWQQESSASGIAGGRCVGSDSVPATSSRERPPLRTLQAQPTGAQPSAATRKRVSRGTITDHDTASLAPPTTLKDKEIIATLEGKVEQLTAALQSKTEEAEGLSHQVKEVRSNMEDRLKTTEQNHSQHIQKYQAALDRLHAEHQHIVKELTDQLKELGQNHSVLIAAKADTEDRLKRLERSSLQQITALKEELERAEAEGSSLQRKLKKSETEGRNLSQRLAELEDAHRKREEELAAANRKLADVDKEIEFNSQHYASEMSRLNQQLYQMQRSRASAEAFVALTIALDAEEYHTRLQVRDAEERAFHSLLRAGHFQLLELTVSEAVQAEKVTADEELGMLKQLLTSTMEEKRTLQNAVLSLRSQAHQLQHDVTSALSIQHSKRRIDAEAQCAAPKADAQQQTEEVQPCDQCAKYRQRIDDTERRCTVAERELLATTEKCDELEGMVAAFRLSQGRGSALATAGSNNAFNSSQGLRGGGVGSAAAQAELLHQLNALEAEKENLVRTLHNLQESLQTKDDELRHVTRNRDTEIADLEAEAREKIDEKRKLIKDLQEKLQDSEETQLQQKRQLESLDVLYSSRETQMKAAYDEVVQALASMKHHMVALRHGAQEKRYHCERLERELSAAEYKIRELEHSKSQQAEQLKSMAEQTLKMLSGGEPMPFTKR